MWRCIVVSMKLMEYVYPEGVDLSCVTLNSDTVQLTLTLADETLITFPLSSDCSVYYDLKHGGGGLRLRVYGEKHIDDHLPLEVLKYMRSVDREYEQKKSRGKADSAASLQKRRDEKEAELVTMREQMLNLITSEPDKSRTYYERKSIGDGGVPGSQDRKERVMQILLAEGVISLVPYDRPLGRAKHYVRLNPKASQDDGGSCREFRSAGA